MTVSQKCTNLGWLFPQFSTCTLAENTVDPFLVIDMTLVADNVSVVEDMEAVILSEVRIMFRMNAYIYIYIYIYILYYILYIYIL